MFFNHRPIGRPLLLLSLTALPASAHPGVSNQVASGADGRFSIGSLQAGKYLVCAAGPQPNDVGSCSWRAVSYITLGAGQQITGHVLVIRQGVRITFRVADPQSRVQIPDIRGFVPDRGRRLRVAVISDGQFLNAQAVGRSPGEVILQALVPARQRASFSLDTDLDFTDGAGASIRRGVAVPVQIPPAATEAIVRLNVN
jgi:hypothetical protein